MVKGNSNLPSLLLCSELFHAVLWCIAEHKTTVLYYDQQKLQYVLKKPPWGHIAAGLFAL